MRRFLSLTLIMILVVYSFLPMSTQATESESQINEEIFYHFLIDRYNNGDPSLSEEVDINDELTYHGGDLLGITKKLDTINELGFTTIILSPLMQNAQRGYHGYWVEDFYEVEPQFGTIDELNNLINEAHGRGIKVVMELVTNYVAKSHEFVSDSDKADWFIEDDVEPIAATEWLNGTVKLNQDNQDVEEYLIDVVDYWMEETDVDGFKLHAADQSSESFLQTISTHIKEKDPQFYLLAGTLQGDQFTESVRNIDEIDIFEDVNMFETLNDVFTEVDQPVSKLFDTWQQSGDEKSGLYVDNINTARFSNNFADNGRNSHTVWQLALGYLYTAPGVPIIYQGSETPMYGPGFPENQYIVDFTATDQDLEKIFEKMGVIHENYTTLSHGEYEQVAVNEGMSLFKRSDESETIYVAINNDSVTRDISIDELNDDLQLRGLLQDHTIRENQEGLFRIGLDRESVEIFVVQPNVGFNWLFISFVVGVFVIFIGFVIWLSRAQKRRESTN